MPPPSIKWYHMATRHATTHSSVPPARALSFARTTALVPARFQRASTARLGALPDTPNMDGSAVTLIAGQRAVGCGLPVPDDHII